MAGEINSNEWWEMKGKKYIEKNDPRDRPREFEIAAQWCLGPVLEIGPAFGAFSNYLPDYVHYLGLDCSDFLLQEARKRHKTRLFVEGSVLKLGAHWTNAFVTTVAMQVLEHFTHEDFDEVMRRMVMVTRKRLVLSVPRGMPSHAALRDDGHLIGWKNDDEFAKDIGRFGKPQIFAGEENHICAILHL